LLEAGDERKIHVLVKSRSVALVLVGAVLGSGASCRGLGGNVENCWEGLSLGDEVVVELVDVYGPSGPYRWNGSIGSGLPSCEGVDGLAVGVTLRLRLVDRRGVAGCFDYSALPLSGVSGVDFPEAIAGAGTGTVFASEAPYCGGHWRLFGARFRDQDPNPFDEEATPGEFPPVRVQRFATGTCVTSCFDEWVGVIRHAPDAGAPAADGGT
jgi:hypothetical protein